MAISNEWCVAVFKCSSDSVKKVLGEFYRFADDLKGVRSLHFLVRDRVEGEVVFSFRVMIEPKFNEIVKTIKHRLAAKCLSVCRWISFKRGFPSLKAKRFLA